MSQQEFAESVLATLAKMAREQGLLDEDAEPQSIPPVPTVPPMDDKRLPRERDAGEDG
jgi:hypothetical protein